LYCGVGLWYPSSRWLREVNIHFVDDSLLPLRVEYKSVDGASTCLDTFCFASGVVVSTHKIDFWLVGLNSPPGWIPFNLDLYSSWGHCSIFGNSIWSWNVSSFYVGLVSIEA
jgi:hypothetical protein